MKGWIEKEGIVIGVGLPGLFLWIIAAVLWPRIFGPNFSNYPNNLIVLNPGTGLGIGIYILCYVWAFYKIIKWREIKYLSQVTLLTAVYGLLLLFYSYNPFVMFWIMCGLLTVLSAVSIVFERYWQNHRKKDQLSQKCKEKGS